MVRPFFISLQRAGLTTSVARSSPPDHKQDQNSIRCRAHAPLLRTVRKRQLDHPPPPCRRLHQRRNLYDPAVRYLRLMRTNPMPTEEVIGRSTRSAIAPTARSIRAGRIQNFANATERHFAASFKGRLLDVGCGTGAFAMEMKRRGWQTAVTEINDAVLSDMRTEGMEAKLPADAAHDGFSAPFDGITAWHVLEHIHHPVALANWARTQLKPGGIFQVTVPNLASWQARVRGGLAPSRRPPAPVSLHADDAHQAPKRRRLRHHPHRHVRVRIRSLRLAAKRPQPRLHPPERAV